jgi:hypothetical protein
MLALHVQRVNQLLIVLRCLPVEDPMYSRVEADLAEARTAMYEALCSC